MTTNNSLTARSSVPKVEKAPAVDATPEKSGHGLLMMVCCAAMIAAFGFVILTAPAGQGWGASALAALPLLGCVGAHLLMHSLMGKSCHGGSADSHETANDNAKEIIK